jgi:glutamyl-tRNA synthetase
MDIRVRIAPSPTGNFHIGTARTALFNWLFARRHGGAFIIRIDDTDIERSKPEYETDILDSLRWLGLTWDEGPYRQSERGACYRGYLEKILSSGAAYHCFCDTEELAAEREALHAAGLPPRYGGKCRTYTTREVEKKISAGVPSVIRFKTPDEEVTFTDMVRGAVTFDAKLFGDMVIAKSLAAPLYNFVSTVDDHEMRISHVIRGEDHIANTPKQILIARALGLTVPHYAHLPLILNAERGKLSKRNAATSVREYRESGFLPGALVNFLALLGWHPEPETDPHTGKPVERELFGIQELVAKFDIARVQKAGAIFNVEKLEWVNSRYLQMLDTETLYDRLAETGAAPPGAKRKQAIAILEAVRERMKVLGDFLPLADFFFALPEYAGDLLIWKKSSREKTVENLSAVKALLDSVPAKKFTSGAVHGAVMPLAEKEGRGEVLWPLRVAVSGKSASPGPFDIISILGKTETLKRISFALEKLTNQELFSING